jgi:hypothetical protein
MIIVLKLLTKQFKGIWSSGEDTHVTIGVPVLNRAVWDRTQQDILAQVPSTQVSSL